MLVQVLAIQMVVLLQDNMACNVMPKKSETKSFKQSYNNRQHRQYHAI